MFIWFCYQNGKENPISKGAKAESVRHEYQHRELLNNPNGNLKSSVGEVELNELPVLKGDLKHTIDSTRRRTKKQEKDSLENPKVFIQHLRTDGYVRQPFGKYDEQSRGVTLKQKSLATLTLVNQIYFISFYFNVYG